jgi:GNAT superfamily N-acetyltransferase
LSDTEQFNRRSAMMQQRKVTMAVPEEPVTIRAYREADYHQVAALWARINRELAPPDMQEQFEQYISTMINGELRLLHDVFSDAKRNAFWVVEVDKLIIGTVGIESRSEDTTELRRMYLDRGHRSRGIAQRMMQCAEARARELGFLKMILSTAEIQRAAIAFYSKNKFQFIRTEVADTMSTKTVGGGLVRLHFDKRL